MTLIKLLSFRPGVGLLCCQRGDSSQRKRRRRRRRRLKVSFRETTKKHASNVTEESKRWREGDEDDGRAPTGRFLGRPLTRTLLLVGRGFVAEVRGPVPVGGLDRRFVHALLHPLHHQVQQRDHRLVHLRPRGRARLKVRDPGGGGGGGITAGIIKPKFTG